VGAAVASDGFLTADQALRAELLVREVRRRRIDNVTGRASAAPTSWRQIENPFDRFEVYIVEVNLSVGRCSVDDDNP
jgi:hypothetical protein